MESKRDSKKRDAPHEVQKTCSEQSTVIQEADSSLNNNKDKTKIIMITIAVVTHHLKI